MVTKRTAFATVKNNTDTALVAVSLVHKYSDNYKNSEAYGIIKPGGSASPLLSVEYNTGFLTTGRDWWVVSWYSPDLKTFHYTDPANFRGFIDGLEHLAPDVISGAAEAVAGLLTVETGPGTAMAAAGAVSTLAKQTTDLLFNTESTEGFKQHILREEDEGQTLVIEINGDGSVVISSKSGISRTKYESKSL